MSYSKIDKIINEWASQNGLVLQKKYKDYEVRSVLIFGGDKQKFQIWIDEPMEDSVCVHAWDFSRNRRDWKSKIANLSSVLDEASEQVVEWQEYDTEES